MSNSDNTKKHNVNREASIAVGTLLTGLALVPTGADAQNKTRPNNKAVPDTTIQTVIDTTGNGSTNLNANISASDPNFPFDPMQQGGSNKIMQWQTAPGKTTVKVSFLINTPMASKGMPFYRGFTPGAKPVSYLAVGDKFYSYHNGEDPQQIASLPATRINDPVVIRENEAVARSKPSKTVATEVADAYEPAGSYNASVSGSNGVYKITVTDPSTNQSKSYEAFRPIFKFGDSAQQANQYSQLEKTAGTKDVGAWIGKKGNFVYAITFTGNGHTVMVATQPMEEAKEFYNMPGAEAKK